MKKQNTVVGYVCDIPIPGTDLVINKEYQTQRIMDFVRREKLDLVAIFEDEKHDEDLMNRPGIKKLLNCSESYDMVLVERVWSLTRKRKDLVPFLVVLDLRNIQLTSASYLWDCLSQQVRHRYMGVLASKQREEAKARAKAKHLKQAA